MEGKTGFFYDIHCHVMNLSHPNFLAFLRRFELPAKQKPFRVFITVNLVMLAYFILNSLNNRFLNFVLDKTGIQDIINRVKNLLVIMENDAGTVFSLLEQDVQKHFCMEGKLVIGDTIFQKMVLTPLMMDFGYKNMTDPRVYYHVKPVKKPVVSQVIDLFYGIKEYLNHADGNRRIFEIYPFLGINTANYSLDQVMELLDKYFRGYTGSRVDLFGNMGKFNGDIESLTANYFSGIKVYPPLGFDPWPENSWERKKVEYLYDFCSNKSIPITTHCSLGGFRTVNLKSAEEFTSPFRWQKVLSKFPRLRLNLGHFGNRGVWDEWARAIVNLVMDYEHVYTDFSCRAFHDNYYKSLSKFVHSFDAEYQEKLKQRILFGSDFMINLLWIDSYYRYLSVFAGTPQFCSQEKHDFCHSNPERFLFPSNIGKILYGRFPKGR
jgi:predicted TIM-barrel fold metal-dependent hydrolase